VDTGDLADETDLDAIGDLIDAKGFVVGVLGMNFGVTGDSIPLASVAFIFS